MYFRRKLCLTKGNQQYYNGQRIMGGVLFGMADEVKIPTTPNYSYYHGNKKIFVENGTFPFGGIKYYF